MKNKITGLIVIIFTFIIGAGLSFLLYIIISSNGIYPSGSETMFHVYRGDLLYKSLANGDGYPLYDRFWYNGIEPMRYRMPLSAFLFAICEAFAAGDVFKGYIIYVIMIFLLGLLSFTVCGFLKKRPVIGLLLGCIWFFVPNNIYTLFVEGSLSRSLAYGFLPLLLFGVYEFLEDGRVRYLCISAGSLFLIILSDLEFAAMTVISLVVFLVVYRFFHRKRRRIFKVLCLIPLVYLMAGIVIYPYMKGSMAPENADYARRFFQNILISLNPLYRIRDSKEAVYFGLSLLVVAVLGTLASNRSSAPGFINAIIILVLSGTLAYPVLQIMPGSEKYLMLRYFSLAMAFIMLGILYWNKLKKWVLAVFLLLICVDIVPSLIWLLGSGDNTQPRYRLSELYENSYIRQAQEICKDRIALFDLSTLGAKGAFLVSDFGTPSMSIFGSDWQCSATSNNTKRLNSAMGDEYYDYMFDRCVEMGADTVIIQKAQAVYGEKSLVKLDRAAERLGYDILYENSDYMLYHLDVDGLYGTITDYDAIGIGYSAYSLSFAFPNIKEAGDDYLDHYSYDFLKDFGTVYLSGFYYDNKEAAEELVLKLAENGVRVVILADGIPEDRESRSKTFLGVTCNVIQFENGYPILYTRDFGEMDCDLFPKGYSKWVTYYLNGMKDVRGTISDNSVELAFCGTGQNENICYIGLNIPFYYYLTQDDNAGKLMQWVMGMEPGQLPERQILPLEIDFMSRGMIINSEEDYVNTALAYHDIFRSDRGLYMDNNMLVVREGQTIINFVYPYFKEGIIMSSVGLLLLTGYLWYMHRGNVKELVRTEEGN